MELSYVQLLAAIAIGKVLYDALITRQHARVKVSKATALQYSTPPALKGAINAGTLKNASYFDSSRFQQRHVF